MRLAAMTENGGILSLASILSFSKIKPLRGLQRHDWRNKMKIVDKNVQSEALLIFVKNMTLGIFYASLKKRPYCLVQENPVLDSQSSSRMLGSASEAQLSPLFIIF